MPTLDEDTLSVQGAGLIVFVEVSDFGHLWAFDPRWQCFNDVSCSAWSQLASFRILLWKLTTPNISLFNSLNLAQDSLGIHCSRME